MSEETQTRIDKKTPRGGAYSIAYWLDQDSNPVSRREATKVNIIEYSESGEEIFRSYLDVNAPHSPQPAIE